MSVLADATTLCKRYLNDWGAICYRDGQLCQAKNRKNLNILVGVGERQPAESRQKVCRLLLVDAARQQASIHGQ